MVTREKDQLCINVVQKLTTYVSLNDEEKSHLAACEDCMVRIVQALDESGVVDANGREQSAERNGDRSSARPTAINALENGRKVFEREFGISLSRK